MPLRLRKNRALAAKKYIWLVDTIRSAGKITKEQIDRKWFGSRYNAKSTSTILKHPEKYHVRHAIKIGDYNVGRDGALLTIPFYMAFLLTEV